MEFELRDISFNYSERKVIDHISISFAPGKFYGIIGPNGSGKTTLVDLLSRHRLPDSGHISYDGRSLSSYS